MLYDFSRRSAEERCRCRSPDEAWERADGSAKVAIACDVLSRADAARERNPARLSREELVEGAACRCCLAGP